MWPRKSLQKDVGLPCQPDQQSIRQKPAERPIEMVTQDRRAEGSVGQRKAFFEAMIQANSDTFITCARSPGATTMLTNQTAKCNSPQRKGKTPFEAEAQENGELQEYNEVQLTFRMAKNTPGPASTPAPLRDKLHGSGAPAVDCSTSAFRQQALFTTQSETIAALQLDLEQKERQWTARLRRKSAEVENLTQVVSELTQGRSKLVTGRAIQAERLGSLQREYERVLKFADLSRTVSKQNMAKAAAAQSRLQMVEEDLGRHKRLVAYLKDHNGRLKLDNLDLHERIRLLERLPLFKYGRESACMLEFTAYKIRETY